MIKYIKEVSLLCVLDKLKQIRAVGAAVARPPHTRKATGSIPVLPIFLCLKDQK